MNVRFVNDFISDSMRQMEFYTIILYCKNKNLKQKIKLKPLNILNLKSFLKCAQD
jgi:hypothetical protein